MKVGIVELQRARLINIHLIGIMRPTGGFQRILNLETLRRVLFLGLRINACTERTNQ